MATFTLEDGTDTVALATICALRMRVKRSAMGSLMLISVSPRRLPAGLDHPRDVAGEGHLADLGACQTELLERAARASRDRAAVALAGRVGVAGKLLQRQAGSRALFVALLEVVSACLQFRVLR